MGTLPSNYRTSTGTILADTQLGLSGITGHQRHSGDGTWAASEVTDSTYLRPIGVTKVFKADCTVAGSGATAYRFDFTINRAISDIFQFNWPIYYTGQAGASASFFLSQEAGFTNYYNFAFASAGLTSDRWTILTQSRRSPDATTGSPNPANAFVRVRAVVTLGAGVTGTFYVGPVSFNWYSQPQVVFAFDDGDETFYTEAFTYMQPRGIVGSVALNRTGSGTPMSAAQVLEMQAAGWSFHSHGDTHTDMTTMTEAELVAQVDGAVSYWGRQGVTLDPDSFILPYGARNALVDSVLARYYDYSCLASGATFPTWDGILDPYKIFRQVVDVPTTTTTTIAALNTAQLYGNSLIYMVHKLANGAQIGNTEIADFKTLVDEVYRRKQANRIQTRNLASFLSGFSNPRKPRV